LLYLGAEAGSMHDDDGFSVMNVAEARRVLTAGDVRSDVAFQNDVNRLLRSLDDIWDDVTAAAPLMTSGTPARS
jgi:hypothetical protein